MFVSSRLPVLGAGLFIAAVCGLLLLPSAYAQPETVTSNEPLVAFDIPAQSLDEALIQFGQQSRQELFYEDDDVAGLTSNPVIGEMTRAEAMRQLLRDTGLEFEQTASGGMMIGTRATLNAQRADSALAGQNTPESQIGQRRPGIEEIIVTGQKKEERIQDVPIAISAFTQEDLTTQQITGGPDLITQVPNMAFTKTNFTGYTIQIRGIGTQAISATTDPAVAVAFNNTPFIRNRFFEQEFYDMERVEVLRGPQGTLYGRNATAGVVNLITAKPVFEDEARFSVDMGNYNSRRLEGMVNIPLVDDKVAFRLAGAWTQRDGYATNAISGNPIDGRDLWSTRASLRFAPNDRLDMNLIWERFNEEDDRIRSGKQLCKKDTPTEVGGFTFGDTTTYPGPQQLLVFGPMSQFSQGCERESLYSEASYQTPNSRAVPYYGPLSALGIPVSSVGSGLLNPVDPYATAVQSRDLRVIESVVDPRYEASADLIQFQVDWQFNDGLTLESETAYGQDRVWSTQDFNRFNTAPGAWNQEKYDTEIAGTQDYRSGVLEDGVFCDPQIGCSDRLVAVDLSTSDSEQFSQEFRLSSQFDGPFNFSLGANFLRYDGEDKYYVFINSLSLYSALRARAEGVPEDPAFAWDPNGTTNRKFLLNGLLTADPSQAHALVAPYIDPNPIESVNDQGHNYFLSRNPYKLTSYAAFGETYWNLTDNLKLTAGLRWSVDQKTAPRIPSQTLVGASFGHPVLEVIEQEWREPTGRLVLDWQPVLSFTDETLIYGSYARGYKAGGANPPPYVPAVLGDNTQRLPVKEIDVGRADLLRPKTFDAEFVHAFELGTKNTLLDGNLTVNAAAFYYNYEGYQVSEIVDRSAYNRNFDVDVWGGEIETDWWLRENIRLSIKGGYQKTRIDDGEEAIDLMDRTAGREGWQVVRPYPVYPSSCILPENLFIRPPGPELRHVGNLSGGGLGPCELAYFFNLDPLTVKPYVPNPPDENNDQVYPGYPGFNPLNPEINSGQGFAKDLGGNELPNAPNYTATVSGDYILPLSPNWTLTFHTDLHWQSESWWRVFNDHEYNRLDDYFTMNLAAILESETGWDIMAYIKNVTDETAITGAFLNSDDTGLTTNVFLTEPRLYGLRITRNWTGERTFLRGLIDGAPRDPGRPYKFHVALAGQVQRWDAPVETLVPSFIELFSPDLDPTGDQNFDLDTGDGWEINLSYQPVDGWKFAARARSGETSGERPFKDRREIGARACILATATCQYAAAYEPSGVGGPFGVEDGYVFRYNYTNSSVYHEEEHTLVDFTVGRDVGIGLFGEGGSSTVFVGVNYADFGSKTTIDLYGNTNWEFPADENLSKYSSDPVTHDHYELHADVDREFKGTGPILGWEASKGLLGGYDTGFLTLDWSLTGGVLFGKRKTELEGEEVAEYFNHPAELVQSLQVDVFPETSETTDISFSRSKDVEVPTLGGTLGLSYKIDRFHIGAGYRWERYYDVIDGGYTEEKEVDRTIKGPYLKVTFGFGG